MPCVMLAVERGESPHVRAAGSLLPFLRRQSGSILAEQPLRNLLGPPCRRIESWRTLSFACFMVYLSCMGSWFRQRWTELERREVGALMGNPGPIVSHGQAFK